LTTQAEPHAAPRSLFSAVFVDLENMAINPDPDHPAFDLARVMKQVRVLSNPIVRMGFADWSKLPQYARTFVLQGFDQIQATYVSGSKNSADMQLCVDALEVVLLRREIEAVFLVSGDADFTPLARAVRRQGRQVIGIGWRDKASLVFRRNCDRFFAYEELPGLSIDEASELAVAERRSERRLASQQARRSVPAYRPGARPAGKPRRGQARAEADGEGEERFLQDPREGGAPAAEEPAEAAAETAEREPKKPRGRGRAAEADRQGQASRSAAQEQPADPVARLRRPPVNFLGTDDQFAVLEALHRELTSQPAPRRRNQIVNAAAQSLSPIRRAQVAAVERILWHAKVYDVVDRTGQRNSVLWNVQLREQYREFDTLRATHDVQLIADAAEAGIFLAAAEWSEQLYGGPEDADLIEDYFRKAAGVSAAFAQETGIEPLPEPEAAEAGGDEAAASGEAAEETAEEAAGETAGEAGHADEAADEGSGDSEDSTEPAGEEAAAGEAPEADRRPEDAQAAGEEATEGGEGGEPGSRAGDSDEPAEHAAETAVSPAEGRNEPVGSAAESVEDRQQGLFGDADQGDGDSGEAGSDAEGRRPGWWSRL
jgi:hypothetical protein